MRRVLVLVLVAGCGGPVPVRLSTSEVGPAPVQDEIDEFLSCG